MSKVVLITGGSSGIGKSIGEFLVIKGFNVYGTSRNPDNYPNSLFPLIAMDVIHIETIKTCISEIISKSFPVSFLECSSGLAIVADDSTTCGLEL